MANHNHRKPLVRADRKPLVTHLAALSLGEVDRSIQYGLLRTYATIFQNFSCSCRPSASSLDESTDAPIYDALPGSLDISRPLFV